MKVVELTKIIVAHRPSGFISGSFRYPGDRARVIYESGPDSPIRIAFNDEYEATVSSEDIKEIK